MLLKYTKAKLDAFENPDNEELQKQLHRFFCEIMDKREPLPMNPKRSDDFMKEFEKGEQMLLLSLMENGIKDAGNMKVFQLECAIEKYSKHGSSKAESGKSGNMV